MTTPSRFCRGDVEQAVRELSNNLSGTLTQSDWQLLRLRQTDHFVFSEEDIQRLVYKGALVEYTNHRQWYGVHPALWELLDYYAPRNGSGAEDEPRG